MILSSVVISPFSPPFVAFSSHAYARTHVVIFNSGYQLRRELFYRHISPITLFAAVGTTISALVCAGLLWTVQALGLMGHAAFAPTPLELLAFGSLIAATDTVSVIAVLQAKRVDPHLFYGA